MRRARILIVDDHALMAEGMAGLLRPVYDVVGICADGRQMLLDAQSLQPDLITLDIGMPRLNGLDAARQVLKQLPAVRLVVVTQQIDVFYVRAALQAGATGYVAKQSASSELLLAVRKALRGRQYISPLLVHAYTELQATLRATSLDGTPDPLTTRQREVLQLVAEGCTTRNISKTLSISIKTVEFHKSALMTSLGLRTTAELVRYALSAGILNA